MRTTTSWSPLAGPALSKQDYLTGIESGELDYHVFEAASDVAVRVSGEVGIVRYQARIDIAVSGRADTRALLAHGLL